MTEDHRMPVLMPESTLAQQNTSDRTYTFGDVLRAIIETHRVVATCLPSHNREGNLPETSFEEAIAWCRLKYPDMGRLEYVLPSLKKEHIADFASRCGMKKGVRYLLVELGFKFKDNKPYPAPGKKTKQQLGRELSEKKNALLLSAIERGVCTVEGLIQVLAENGIFVVPQAITKYVKKLVEQGLVLPAKSTKRGTCRKVVYFPAGKVPEGYTTDLKRPRAKARKIEPPKIEKVVIPKKPKYVPKNVLKLRVETIKKAIESGFHRTAEIRSALLAEGQDITETRCYQILIELVEKGEINCCKVGKAFYYSLPGQPIPLHSLQEETQVVELYQQKEAS